MADKLPEWSPFREMDRFRRDFDDLFDRFLGGNIERRGRNVRAPMLESYVENGKLVIRADLPGVNPKDVDIRVSGDQLTIRGKRERTHEEKGRSFLVREISYGSFERSMRLPSGIKTDDIKASYRDGVLELVAPVPEEVSRSRKIEVEREEAPGQSKS